MRKLVVFLMGLFLLISSSAFAEAKSTAAGNIEFGLGKLISYDRIWDDTNDWNMFQLGTFGMGTRLPSNEAIFYPTPVISGSYFVIDNLGLGIIGGYTYIKKENSGSDPTQAWFVGPEIKFYVGVSDSMLLDAHGSFVYCGMDDGTNKDERVSVGLGVNVNFLLTKNFAFFLGLDYAYYFERTRDGDSVPGTDYHNISLNAGLKVFVTFNDSEM